MSDAHTPPPPLLQARGDHVFLSTYDHLADLFEENIAGGTDVEYSTERQVFYILDRDSSTVSTMDLDGECRRMYEGFGAGAGELLEPHDMCVRNGLIYIIEYSGEEVMVFDLDMNYVRSVAIPKYPKSVAVDSAGDIYVVLGHPEQEHLIFKKSSTGLPDRSFAERIPPYLGNINPMSTMRSYVTIDPADGVYLSHFHYYLLREYGTDGELRRQAEGFVERGRDPSESLRLSALNTDSTSRWGLVLKPTVADSYLVVPVVMSQTIDGLRYYSFQLVDLSHNTYRSYYLPDMIKPSQVFIIEGSAYVFDSDLTHAYRFPLEAM